MTKIALLVCDIPIPAVVEKHGDYFQLFTKCFNLPMDPFHVFNSEFPAADDSYSVYIITGSKFSAYENHPWIERLKQFVKNTRAKVIGICFGHQIIAEAMGGKIEKNPLGISFY
jgi:GMP synthase-like glutamine amidotransferase